MFIPTPVLADGGAPDLAYIAGTSTGISILDINQQRITGNFAVGGNPHALYLSLDGRFLYVAQPALDQVSMLATKTGQTLCSAHMAGQPSLLAFDTTDNTLFAAGNQSAMISEFNASTCQLMRTIPTDGSVYGLATLEPADITGDNQLWVATTNDLLIIDTRTAQLLHTLTLPDSPRLLSLPLGGAWAYATTEHGQLYAIQRTTYRILRLLTGGLFGAMDFDQTTGEVYVPDQLHQQIDVLVPPDPASVTAPHEPERVYHFSSAPQAVAITNDGNLGFVALSTGQVAMIDLLGRTVITTLRVGGDPRFVITGLYPPVIGTTPQQASLAQTWGTIGGYLLVGLAFIVPLWWVWRRQRRSLAGSRQQHEDAPHTQ